MTQDIFATERDLINRAEKMRDQATLSIRKKFKEVQGDLDATILLHDECPHCVHKALQFEAIQQMVLQDMLNTLLPGVVIKGAVDGEPIGAWRILSFGAIMWLENVTPGSPSKGSRKAYDIQNASLWRERTSWTLTWDKEQITLRIMR